MTGERREEGHHQEGASRGQRNLQDSAETKDFVVEWTGGLVVVSDCDFLLTFQP